MQGGVDMCGLPWVGVGISDFRVGLAIQGGVIFFQGGVVAWRPILEGLVDVHWWAEKLTSL